MFARCWWARSRDGNAGPPHSVLGVREEPSPEPPKPVLLGFRVLFMLNLFAHGISVCRVFLQLEPDVVACYRLMCSLRVRASGPQGS